MVFSPARAEHQRRMPEKRHLRKATPHLMTAQRHLKTAARKHLKRTFRQTIPVMNRKTSLKKKRQFPRMQLLKRKANL